MLSKLKRALLLALCIAVPLSAAYAAGLWPTLPLVGGSAVCSSTSTGVSAQVCTTTTPAGPTIVTGSETIPADTNLASGRNPQSVRIPMASLNALPFTYNTLSPGVAAYYSSAVSTDGGMIVLNSAALTGTFTILFPPSPIDGQQYAISSRNNLNALSPTGYGGASINNGPSALTVATTGGPMGYLFRYRAANTTWYRLQ